MAEGYMIKRSVKPAKLTFLLPNGKRIIVRRLRPASDWAEGERLSGYIGGLFGFFGTRVLVYFVGTVSTGQLAAMSMMRWGDRYWARLPTNPRIQILPPKGYRLEEG